MSTSRTFDISNRLYMLTNRQRPAWTQHG